MMKSNLLLFFTFFIFFDGYGQIGFEEHVVIDNSYSMVGAGGFSGESNAYAADIDGDGDLDMLSASSNDDKIAWYENTDGLGTFSIQKIISTNASNATSLCTADIDGDGDLDVISTSYLSNGKIIWYENTDGLGSFGVQQIISTNSSRSIYATDIDGDGDMDLLSSHYTEINWYENTDGSGDFELHPIVNGVNGILSIYATDIDGDGDKDIFSASSTDDKISWYENINGLGTFNSEEVITTSAAGAKSVHAADIDNDGDLDIFSASSDDDKIAWYENVDGLGSFGVQQIISIEADGAQSVYTTDIDGDGDMDVISSSLNDEKIAWYENTDGLGTFGQEQIISDYMPGAFSVFAADLNGNGNMDVFSTFDKTSAFYDQIIWFRNIDGQGSFNQEDYVVAGAQFAENVFAADIDGDGDGDILSFSGKVAWYKNEDGLGTFDVQENIAYNGSKSGYGADIDGDGDIDILSASGEITWFENTDGLGTFSIEQIISINAASGFVYAADIDSDGDIDVLSASSTKITWYENTDGLGNFGGEQVLSTNVNGARSVYAVDLDGDGDMDVISTSLYDEVVWYENMDGQGTFNSGQNISTNSNDPISSYFGDIDNDGDMDVVVGFAQMDEIAWFENIDGLGTFAERKIITSEMFVSNLRAIYVDDVDGDGDMDVLSASADGYFSILAWYENIDGQGNFGIQQILSTDSEGLKSVYTADIDGDGDTDVLSASDGDGRIAWQENKGFVVNKINGNITLDNNPIGCDINDPVVPELMVTIDDGIEVISMFTLSNGYFQIFPGEGDFTTSLIIPNYYTANPSLHLSNFVGVGNVDIANFCLEPNQTVNDLNISLFPLSDSRPGFDATYQLVFHNVGTTQLNGTTTLEFNDTKLNFLTASEPNISQNNNTLTFDFENLNPFETRTIDLTFNVLPPPTVNIDDILNFTATINPIAGDFTEDDNIFTFDQTVIGSYDPNDIRVLEGEEVLIENAGQYLHYIIRFQNTGTADAINVRVENILDDKLDWNTIQLESYSHPNRVEIKDGNEVSFIFDGIYLPDSTTNEPASNGFIAYKIKPKSDIAIGDIILNTADIFFDFNEAVVTNTVMTKIVDPVSIDENTQLRFSIFPIPTSGILMVQSESTIAQIEIYDQLGQLVLIKSNANQIDLSNLNRGFYFCKVRNESGDFGIKKVVKE